MKSTVEFSIEFEPDFARPTKPDRLVLKDKQQFDEFCRRYRATFSHNPNFGTIEIQEYDPFLADVFREVQQMTGQRPIKGMRDWHRNRENGSVFACWIRREFSKRDILDAPLLELGVNGAGSRIAEFRGMNADESVKAHGGPTVPKKGREFGFIDGQWPALAVTDSLMDKLLAAHLKGLEFREVELDKPAKDGVRLWQPWSLLRLPRSKVDLYSGEGADFVEGSYENGCFMDDGPYQPPLFRYEKKALEGLPPFDIAMTHERTGAWGDCLRHTIISQRFRQVLASLKVKGVGYKPVILE